MVSWKRFVCLATLTATPGLALAQAVNCTRTLNPADNLTLAVEQATPGDTICLNAGTYTPQPTGPYSAPAGGDKSFAITKRVRIVGRGATPNDVRLTGAAASDYAVKLFPYNITVPASTPPRPSGASLENLRIEGSLGGVFIGDPAVFGDLANPAFRLSDIKLLNVVIKTIVSDAGQLGVFSRSVDRLVVDRADIESYQAGLGLYDNTESLVMRSNLVRTWAPNAVGFQFFGGERNVVVDNVIGSAKANPADNTDSSYPIQSGNTVFYNSRLNRFEGNTLQGHRDDGLDFTALDLPAGVVPTTQNRRKAADNYASNNTVISTGFAAGRVAGSGIWVNCGSDNAWLYANDSRGSAECGTCVWNSNSALLLGNKLHDNRLAGIVVSGGQETTGVYCPVPEFIAKPTSTFLRNNFAFYNGNEQVVIRKSDKTDMSLNFFSSTNGFSGLAAPCATAGCQAAFAFEGDPADAAATSIGVRAIGNTSADNQRGIQGDDGKVSGFVFAGNRMLNAGATNRFVSSGLNLDSGSNLGGNYWASHTAFGNPSASNPYAGVFHNLSNNTGLVVDRFPFQTEDFGRGPNVTVFEPYAGTYARGSRRTVRWAAPGCTYVDILVDGILVASNHPNTGYAVVTLAASTTLGTQVAVVRCKDSFARDKGSSGSSPSFTVATAGLTLLAPGRDDVVDAGSNIWVAWKTATAGTPVTIAYSTDGGQSFTTLDSGVTENFKRVAIPAGASSAYGVIKVTATGGLEDRVDGVFAVRGASGAGFTNVTAGRQFRAGSAERLEWASPTNSRRVTVTATRGATTVTVAENYPDRGHLDWIVDDMGGAGAITLNIAFKDTTGVTTIGTASSANGTVIYPTTITFGTAPSVAPGGGSSITAASVPPTAITFTSLTTGVCSVNASGTSLLGLAAGTCTIQASSAGDATHAPYTTTISFTVGQLQVITWGPAPTLVVNGTAALSATASSGLPVTFTSLTPSVCTVTSGTNTANGLAAGTCIVLATQAGNSTFSPTQADISFQVVTGTSIVRLANISTRGRVETGNDVMIGGFIIGGAEPKKVLITARGPSLEAFGVTGTLSNPKLELYQGSTKLMENDNWQTQSPDAGGQAAANEINALGIFPNGLAPSSPQESALLVTLNPGAYTAVVSGANNGTGVGIVEVFEASRPEIPLVNISTRGQVQTGNNVMIGGFIIQGTGQQRVLITARGPSLSAFGIANPLSNPRLEIYSGQTKIYENDNWQTQTTVSGGQAPSPASEIAALGVFPNGLAPSDASEAALLITLPPGSYTAIVSGVGNVTGVGIVEVFKR